MVRMDKRDPTSACPKVMHFNDKGTQIESEWKSDGK